MKKISLFFAVIFFVVATHAQLGVTKQGTKALAHNDTTVGIYNSAFGYYALNTNTTGTNNTAVGANVLVANNGNNNTGIGYASLYSNTSGSYNTALGVSALNANTTAMYNTAVGAKALQKNNGTSNTGIGYASLYSNTSGYDNTALGSFAMQTNSTGRDNVALGFQSLYLNTSGRENIAIGSDAMHANTGGNYNVAVGFQSLFANTNGLYNTALGSYAMQSNTTGMNNTAVGHGALFSNTDQGSNTAIGADALYNNTDGYANTAIGESTLLKNTIGASNTGIGYAALFSNTTGEDNTATGYWSMHSNTSGNYNTAAGDWSMYSNTSGYSNTAMGHWSLFTNTTGYENTTLGFGADVSGTGLHNATAIGYDATVNTSNTVRVGGTGVTSIGGQVGWTTFSDGRYKKDVRENIPGLAFINSLRPVSYTVNIQGLNEYYHKRKSKIPDSVNAFTADNPEIKNEQNEAGKIIHTGFIAQEVEQAAGKLNYEFNGVDKPKTSDDLYGLRYDEFVVPLVKAVQELSTMNDKKDSMINDLQKQINELRSMFSTTSQPQNMKAVFLTGASIEQNIPNPFNNTTTIHYTLPQTYASAKIIITDINGKLIKELNINGTGHGSLNIAAAGLTSGNYNYSLYIDGRMVATKQMTFGK